ncbi:hypothetical protein D915_007569 [Fasciola hepatica]|uniref:Uncharacterized protein n=1 Tax=Fasciola hepatica TaxID=6192 RepID=A0A4E0R1C6_FASHE|nr:hypothetical protein D915_007569 [Fasciola hepatica]
MPRRVLEPIILGVSVTSIILAMILDDWNCGSLFRSCLDHYRAMTLSVIVLFFLGLACLCVAFFMDLIHCFSTPLDLNPRFTTTRLFALSLGLILLSAGLIVYTAEMGRQWSYLSGVTGAVFAVQGAVLALVSSQCVRRNSPQTQVTHTVIQSD